ncbi:MAG: ABC transporter ATP-binding protein [Sphaerobacteraceae bacterium]|nr:MAG: ABC transporter ATP-binding protein [Sphaerobacteraceae bacterium]
MRVILRIFSYIRPYWKYTLAGYIALLISIGMQMSIPRLVEYVIDGGLVQDSTRVLTIGVLAIVAVGLTQGVFTYLRSFMFQFLAEQVGYDIRNHLYRHLQFSTFSFFDRAHTGQLMSRGTEDINSIRRFLMFSMRMLVQSFGMLLVITIILLTINWQLALLSLALMPVLVVTALHFGQTIRPLYLAVQQQFGVMTTRMQENLAGTRVVRSFAQEDREIEEFDHELELLYDRNIDAIKKSAFYFPFMTVLSTLSIAMILWYGGRLVVAGDLTVGQLTAFYLYLAMLQMPARVLGFVVNSAARAIASGERIFEVLDQKPSIRSKPDATVLDPIEGRVEFQNVWFRYPETDEYALKDISFVAEPNQRVALLGTTGAGKSSITAMIPRFYDVTSGRVLIDGHNVKDLDLPTLRRQIGIVLQDTFLFSVTIKENIAYGRMDATDEEVIAAAKAARAHDFILEMSEGYDTVIGERGVSLSGGQKQRIAIARGLLMAPSILILDDATSNVDTETEFAIQAALAELMKGRTTFVIAHRLLTLKSADQILVMDDGEIIERGKHDDLLRRGGAYARIYDLQLKEQEEVASIGD